MIQLASDKQNEFFMMIFHERPGDDISYEESEGRIITIFSTLSFALQFSIFCMLLYSLIQNGSSSHVKINLYQSQQKGK